MSQVSKLENIGTKQIEYIVAKKWLLTLFFRFLVFYMFIINAILTQNQISILEKNYLFNNLKKQNFRVRENTNETYTNIFPPNHSFYLLVFLLSFLSSWILLTLQYFNSTSLIVGRIFFYQLSRIEVIFLNMFLIRKKILVK
jgi:hypothetical protein